MEKKISANRWGCGSAFVLFGAIVIIPAIFIGVPQEEAAGGIVACVILVIIGIIIIIYPITIGPIITDMKIEAQIKLLKVEGDTVLKNMVFTNNADESSLRDYYNVGSLDNAIFAIADVVYNISNITRTMLRINKIELSFYLSHKWGKQLMDKYGNPLTKPIFIGGCIIDINEYDVRKYKSANFFSDANRNLFEEILSKSEGGALIKAEGIVGDAIINAIGSFLKKKLK